MLNCCDINKICDFVDIVLKRGINFFDHKYYGVCRFKFDVVKMFFEKHRKGDMLIKDFVIDYPINIDVVLKYFALYEKKIEKIDVGKIQYFRNQKKTLGELDGYFSGYLKYVTLPRIISLVDSGNTCSGNTSNNGNVMKVMEEIKLIKNFVVALRESGVVNLKRLSIINPFIAMIECSVFGSFMFDQKNLRIIKLSKSIQFNEEKNAQRFTLDISSILTLEKIGLCLELVFNNKYFNLRLFNNLRKLSLQIDFHFVDNRKRLRDFFKASKIEKLKLKGSIGVNLQREIIHQIGLLGNLKKLAIKFDTNVKWYDEFVRAIKSLKKLKSLKLINYCDDESVYHHNNSVGCLVLRINDECGINELSIDNYLSEYSLLNQMILHLSTLKSIKKLCLVNETCSSRFLQTKNINLELLQNIEFLDLSHNRPSKETMIRLRALISSSKVLKVIVLRDCGLSDDNFGTIIDSLSKREVGLKYLDLSYNDLSYSSFELLYRGASDVGNDHHHYRYFNNYFGIEKIIFSFNLYKPKMVNSSIQRWKLNKIGRTKKTFQPITETFLLILRKLKIKLPKVLIFEIFKGIYNYYPSS